MPLSALLAYSMYGTASSSTRAGPDTLQAEPTLQSLDVAWRRRCMLEMQVSSHVEGG